MEIKNVLNERGSRYGSYFSNAMYTQNVYADIMQFWVGNKLPYPCKPLDAVCKETIHMVVHKLSRIHNGDKSYLDNYVDIIGYCQLMLDTCEIELPALPTMVDYKADTYNLDIIIQLKRLVAVKNSIKELPAAMFKAKLGAALANIISKTQAVIYNIEKGKNDANNGAN